MARISQHKPTRIGEKADVCLLLEGTYPYVRGGVSSWTHDIIRNHSDLSFHIVCILPGTHAPELKFELPDNVVSVSDVFLRTNSGSHKAPMRNVISLIQPVMQKIADNAATLDDFASLVHTLRNHRAAISADYLLNSRHTWEALVEMYEARYHDSSMLDYFWTWRALFGSIFSILRCNLPNASVYHTMCTGYAGLLAARAKIEKQKPVLLTEHGIYTNERRIEIASADWLEETASSQLTIDNLKADLRDLWIDGFSCYSQLCYEACDRVVTLYEGNQVTQRADGADPEKMQVIPNGIDTSRFEHITHKPQDVPTIAMIGRVVPIKDVKSFILACSRLYNTLGELKAYIMGNTDEDPEYYEECLQLVTHLNLQDVIEFTGAVKIEDYLPVIEVVVFTSISEAQPLVILEAGAAGIPVVSTNVGACDEMINGSAYESPQLGSGGAVVPLSNPSATAQATLKLLTDKAHHAECAQALKTRVETYYNKELQVDAYHSLYASLIQKA